MVGSQETKQRLVVGIYGSWREPIPRATLRWAHELGQAIAEEGHILLTGGSGGVLLEARRGCRSAGGSNVGVIPEAFLPENVKRRAMIDLVIPTGAGALGRMPLIAHTADIALVVGGGAGTLVEVALTYLHRKPVVVIDGLQKRQNPSFLHYLIRKRVVRLGETKAIRGWLDGKPSALVAPIHVISKDESPSTVLKCAIGLMRKDSPKGRRSDRPVDE